MSDSRCVARTVLPVGIAQLHWSLVIKELYLTPYTAIGFILCSSGDIGWYQWGCGAGAGGGVGTGGGAGAGSRLSAGGGVLIWGRASTLTGGSVGGGGGDGGCPWRRLDLLIGGATGGGC